ncbi:MAG: c-type cytochrome [Burkholderiales bacterium]
MSTSSLQAVAVAAVLALSAGVNGAMAADVDADAAQALLNKSDCGKCHAVDKKKDGPSFKETAEKLKGKPGAEDEVYKHITTQPMVKIDGKEEKHKAVKSTDEADIMNLVRWILSR